MKHKLILFTLAGVNFTHIMFTMILMPLGDVFMEEFSISALQFSHLVTVYAFAAFLSGFVGIFLMDRFNRKTTLLFLYSGFAVTAFGCGLVQNYEQLLILRCISGAFGGVIGALALSIVSDLFPFRERSSALGILMAGFSAAAALGVPFGLMLADWFNWRLPFFFIGGLGFLLTAFILLTFPGIRPEADSRRMTLWDNPLVHITKDKNQVMALTVAFFLVLGHFIIIPFIAPYMIRNAGFDMQQISYIYLIGGGLTVFSTPAIGNLTDRIGPAKALWLFMSLSFLPVVLLTNLWEVNVVFGLVVTSAFFVLGSGRMIAPQTMITASAPTETRGGFMSLKSSLQQLSIALSSFICGLIVQVSHDGTFVNYDLVGYLSIAICLFAIYLAMKLKVAAGN
jgi:MFS transporter, DHA1 family, inner membrane transport protein